MECYAFWAKNVPFKFQKIMNKIFTQFSTLVINYIDDISMILVKFDKYSVRFYQTGPNSTKGKEIFLEEDDLLWELLNCNLKMEN